MNFFWIDTGKLYIQINLKNFFPYNYEYSEYFMKIV